MNRSRFPGRSIGKLMNKKLTSYRELTEVKLKYGPNSPEYKESKEKLMDMLAYLRGKYCHSGSRTLIDNGGEIGGGINDRFTGFEKSDGLHQSLSNKSLVVKEILNSLELGNSAITIKEEPKPKNLMTKGSEPECPRRTARSRKSTYKIIQAHTDTEEEETSLRPTSPTPQQKLNDNDPFRTPVKYTYSSCGKANIDSKEPLQFSVPVSKTETVTETGTEGTAILFPQTQGDSLLISGVVGKRSTVPFSNSFFQGKEKHVAAVTVLVSGDTKDFKNVQYESGLIQCGVCLELNECGANKISCFRKYGAFLCQKCIVFFTKIVKIAKKAQALECLGKQGSCEITCSTTEYCEACFTRSCLLMLDITDDLYYKLWRSVPPIAKNWVPPTPPRVKRYPNRGKIIFANILDGSILQVLPYKSSKGAGAEKSIAGAGDETETKNSRGIKRLLPNEQGGLGKVGKARVKQARRNIESTSLPRAVFGDTIDLSKNGAFSSLDNQILNNKPVEPLQENKLDKQIKVIAPLDDDTIEENGYPVITSGGEDEPPKPLCFSCGSAGINQLIFCCVCSEPFHAYCTEDDLLLAMYLSEFIQEKLEEKNSQSIYQRFRKWKCQRCVECKGCKKKGSHTDASAVESIVQCSSCYDSYHFTCAKKASCVKPDKEKWLCGACLKCTSCGIKLTKSSQNHFRKLMSASRPGDHIGNGNQPMEREMLCLECFRRRQKGSYCPVCLSCYDDNDWDTKMMECDRCACWIHSKCEGLNDEKYFILSSLPETIPYVCRLCSPMKLDVGWRQAVKTEFLDGCLKVLDFFQKKAVGMSRKRRALTFDEDERPILPPTLPSPDNNHEESTAEESNLNYFSPSTSVLLPFQQQLLDDKDNTSTVSSDDTGYCSSNHALLQLLEVKDEPMEISVEEDEEKHNNTEDEDDIIRKKFNLKDCIVKLVDLDVSNRKKKSVSPTSIRVTRSRTRTGEGETVKTPTLFVKQPLNSGSSIRSNKSINLSTTTSRSSTPTPILMVKIPLNSSGSVSSSRSTPTPTLIPIPVPIGETTPVKQAPLTESIPSPVKIFTPTRIVNSFTEAVKKTSCFWKTVSDFRRMCIKLIPSYFDELYQRNGDCENKFTEYYEDAVKQVFPWFDPLTLKYDGDLNLKTAEDILSDIIKEEEEDAEVDFANTNIEGTINSDPEADSIVFQDVYWESTLQSSFFMDRRKCAFCNEEGDLPLNMSGRLLYSGPGEWVHINCAIWSSEVWEEETGALQQVEGALIRSRRTPCAHCDGLGATLNCCAGSCRNCYHFMCAIEAHCSLMQDKTCFCPSHLNAAKGQEQTEMHVTRKVYIGFSSTSKKRDLKLPSASLKIFIGSMKISSLGKIYPISSVTNTTASSTNLLVPVHYESKRLKLTSGSSLSLEVESEQFKSFLKYPPGLIECQETKGDYHFVIPANTKRKDKSNFKSTDMKAFFQLLESAPKFFDEFGIQWEYPSRISTNRNYIPCSENYENMPKINRTTIDWTMSSTCDINTFKTNGFSSEFWPNEVVTLPLLSRPIVPMAAGQGQGPAVNVNLYESASHELGLLHPAIRYLIEQLPGIESVVGNHKFHFHKPCISPEETPVTLSLNGCARLDGFMQRKPFDMFGWLASRHRQVPSSSITMSEETVKSKGLPIAMRFRNLKERASKDLVVLPSHIHGRGLYARRDIEIGEMLIEYAGEVIRSALCDLREMKYENAGIGCYMFRVNRDLVIDATMKGNAARFINHSCDPNCESKSVKILGKDHILIFALRNIGRGEELTYDYKFERESDKLPCSCGAKKCRRFLN